MPLLPVHPCAGRHTRVCYAPGLRHPWMTFIVLSLSRILALVFLTVAAGAGLPGRAETLPALPPLNQQPTGLTIPGKFVWSDLFAEDIDGAKRFYSSLLGWSWRTFGSGVDEYHIAYTNDRPVAGLVYREARAEADAKAGWILYASAENPSALEAQVKSAGGRLLVSPIDVPFRGTHAVYKDGEGALFGVLKSATGDPEDFRADMGEWVWTHLFSRNSREAARFYSQLLGYESIEVVATEQADDVVLASAGSARAGIGVIGPKAPEGARAAWVGFIRVPNVDSAAGLVEELGGSVLMLRDMETFDGRLAVVADAAGATFGLMSLNFENLVETMEESQ